MKKLLLTLVVLSAGFSALAQSGSEWFVSVSGGVGRGSDRLFSFIQGTESSTTAGYTPCISLTVGKYFNETVGLGLSYQGTSIDISSNGFNKENASPFNYLSANAYFRVLDFLVPYVHAGYIFAKENSIGGGAGCSFPVKVCESIRIVPDLKYIITRDCVHTGPQGGICGQGSASIGIQYAF